jgi:hydrogenase maturation protein HypF
MPSCHLHIEGQVQGVGFRPYVYRLASELKLKGRVSNGMDGVHITITGTKENIQKFYKEVIDRPPQNARILNHTIHEVPESPDKDFQIVESSPNGRPNLLLTPDLGLCDKCRDEIMNPTDRRRDYAFTTCIHCGPRYSIIRELPYDRESTTMQPFVQCEECSTEYNDPRNRRYYSQTNSCSSCGIEMQLLDNHGKVVSKNNNAMLSLLCAALEYGRIVCVKGIGGFLLLADASNKNTIKTLRSRKNRPSKPFAIVYPDLEGVREDAHVSPGEEQTLKSIEAPIVLLRKKENPKLESMDELAPGLDRIGVMLPYTPFLALLMKKWKKPIIATSGNLSGSPIFYQDDKAIKNLSQIADFFVTNNREILIPQDDSVLQFTDQTKRKIVHRRSRGYAPTFLPHSFGTNEETILAMGGELKSSFALLNQSNLYVSQYLGDLANFETQESFNHTVSHLLKLFRTSPQKIIIDQHPGYFSSATGKEMSRKLEVPVQSVQHHLAHFSAVLAENDLLHTDDPVLGIIWDGTGWGEDGAIWGGEFFLYQHQQFRRVANLDYFDHLLGDKISREPRLSALALCKDIPEAEVLLQDKFTKSEWSLYKKMLAQSGLRQTSSMGRFFDGVASLLGLCNKSSYEGEAAMYLEALAGKAIPLLPGASSKDRNFSRQTFIRNIVNEILHGAKPETIAYDFHVGLVNWIAEIATREKIHKMAFSGGVFQNGLLVDLIQKTLGHTYELYFHKQLSPNDECIGFGQIAYDHIQRAGVAKTAEHIFNQELVTI